MTLILFLPIFGMGCALVLWGLSYRRQGKRFPARYGDSTPPEQVIGCGVLALLLSLIVLVYGV